MSLFGSILGDFEDDPIFGSHMQHMQRMNNMMHSMMADPFGMMGGQGGMGHHQAALMDPRQMQAGRQAAMPGMQMMPFGFPPMPSPMNMGGLFGNFQNMGSDPNCHSFSSSSVMTMTSGPDGRPQVYQESMSTRCAPGGVKETKKTVSDSRTGKKSMAIGHHIGDRAHILEREQNIYSREQEERQEFINLEEEEAEDFNREWQTKTRRSGGSSNRLQYRSQDQPQLALPSTAPRSTGEAASAASTASPAHRTSNSSNNYPQQRRASVEIEEITHDEPQSETEESDVDEADCVEEEEDDEATARTYEDGCSADEEEEEEDDLPQNLSTSSSTSKGRKREHSPEPEIICEGSSSNKRASMSAATSPTTYGRQQ